MKDIRLILVRHGNTFESEDRPVWVGSQTDIPLTAYGCEQITLVAEELAAQGVSADAVYHGDLLRQQQSATILSKRVGGSSKACLSSAALNELDYGAWEGLHTDEVKAQWPEEYGRWLNEVKWPETVFADEFEERLRRLSAWFEELELTYSDGATLVATSSNGILRLLTYFDRARWQEITEAREGASLKVRTGAYCEVLLNDAGLTVQSWNKRPTLGERS